MKQPEFGSKILRTILQFKIAVLFTGAAILLYACENNLEQIKAFSSPENLPVVEAYNFETFYTDSGKVRFFLKTPKLLQFENEGVSYIEFPQGIELIKYDNNQRIISSITADYAKNFEREEKWEAKNNVVATNAQGDTLKTEHLIWEERTEKIYTEEFVRIIRPDQIITGIGFESDQSLQNWKINNPRGTIYIEMDDNSQPLVDPSAPPLNRESQNSDQQILNFGIDQGD
jgi:LPS export ABC transporter protein LptC